MAVMTWRIRMSEIDSSGRAIPSTSRVLDYRARTEANAFAFKDNILSAMLKISFRRLPQIEVFEEPETQASRQWGPQ
jgi:hypothetical protein